MIYRIVQYRLSCQVLCALTFCSIPFPEVEALRISSGGGRGEVDTLFATCSEKEATLTDGVIVLLYNVYITGLFFQFRNLVILLPPTVPLLETKLTHWAGGRGGM
jgi:hypothetical protein